MDQAGTKRIRVPESRSMSTARSLEGKRIVLTRAEQQARELADRLREVGASVLLLPAVHFPSLRITTALDDAIASLEEFDWLLFTSANAVRFFAQRARKSGREQGRHAKPALRRRGSGNGQRGGCRKGYAIDYTAQKFLGVELARELGPALAGKRVLLPRSGLAGRDLPEALSKAGAVVTEVVAYDTRGFGAVEPGVLEAVREARVDAVSFFSPSAVENVRRELGQEAFARLGARAARWLL